MALDTPNAFSPSCLVLACVADGWIVMAAALGPQSRSARVDS